MNRIDSFRNEELIFRVFLGDCFGVIIAYCVVQIFAYCVVQYLAFSAQVVNTYLF
jgi:hypothetical protein